MTAVETLTVLFCAYDIVLIPVIVFRRTKEQRILWVEIGYSIGIDLLLLRSIIVVLNDKNPTDIWLAMVASALIALLSYYLTRSEKS